MTLYQQLKLWRVQCGTKFKTGSEHSTQKPVTVKLFSDTIASPLQRLEPRS